MGRRGLELVQLQDLHGDRHEVVIPMTDLD
jgi:hypothetical protein